MAKAYSEEWRKNVSEANKRWQKLHPLTEEQKKKLAEYAEKGRQNRKAHRLPLEKLKSWTDIRKRIFEERGKKCEDCGWAEINPFNGDIPVQIDHLDGNKKNNKRENLKIRCPNCHSLTEHFMFYGKKHLGKKNQYD